MGLVNKKYVVAIDNGSTMEKTDILYYKSSSRKGEKVLFEMTPSKAFVFVSKNGATKCRDRLRNNGYDSWVETFYKI